MALHLNPAPYGETFRLPLHALRWSAILAGLVVGVAGNLVLVLLGAAIGLAVFAVGDSSAAGVPISAAVWDTVCMVVAAFAGGYVAARSAGMRRAADGVLHGVVAWGVTLLLSIFFIVLSAEPGVDGMFATASPATSEIAGRLDEAERQEVIGVLQGRLGLSTDQASRLVDQALLLSGREDAVAPAAGPAAAETLDTLSAVTGWLTGAILLSLLAATGGGLLGARGSRRPARPGDRA